MENKEFVMEIRNTFMELKKMKRPRQLEESIKGMIPILNYLFDHMEEETSPKNIENAFHVSSARIARVLNQLAEKNLIERKSSENDKRKTIVILTAEGKKFIEERKAELGRYTKKALNNISDEEKEEFLKIIKKMVNNLLEGEENNA